MQVMSIETARQQRDDDKARRLYPDVIRAALQLADAAEALAILEQLAGTASTLHMLAGNCKCREGGQA